jgi:hypothetical protein
MFGFAQTMISCLLSLVFFCGALMIQHNIVTVLDLYTAIYAIMFAGVQTGGNILFLTKLSASKNAAACFFETILPQLDSMAQSDSLFGNRVSASYIDDSQAKKIRGEI